MTATARAKPNYVQRPPRRAMAADVTVVDGCGRQLHSRLWNISETGFMVECEEKVPLGALVTVDLPGRGPVRAEVRWVLGWRFGASIIDEENAADPTRD